ncbi:DUF6221 family protein [Nocardia vaccinii]|uniref:DUF6221 family protein n=1 Tax=Nocardia vaccinii TaxID=1822 RepID=UPI0008332F8D|nr:DUF6221 family protein [Nocardia vaccinii]
MTIEEFIEARLAEDEQIARSAIDPERPGMHWCWEDGERDPLQPGVEVEGLDTHPISLRTVEEYPTRSVGPLPAFILAQVEARQQGGLWHIARHDPARVLRQCAAMRKVFEEEHFPDARSCYTCHEIADGPYTNRVPWPCPTVRAIAVIWSDHPDYQEEWEA